MSAKLLSDKGLAYTRIFVLLEVPSRCCTKEGQALAKLLPPSAPDKLPSSMIKDDESEPVQASRDDDSQDCLLGPHTSGLLPRLCMLPNRP